MCRSTEVEVVLKFSVEVPLTVAFKPKTRGDRRDRTDRIIRRRYKERYPVYLSDLKGWLTRPWTWTGRPVRPEPHIYAKRGVWCCHCAKREKGRPRVNHGMCNIGDRNRIYKWRQDNWTLRNMIHRVDIAWDDDEVAYLFGKIGR